MCVQHAPGVLTRFMNRAVNRVARRIDLVWTVERLFAREIDAHQIRSRHFIEHQSIRIDQKIMRTGNLCRDVREDQIVPTEVRHEP